MVSGLQAGPVSVIQSQRPMALSADAARRPQGDHRQAHPEGLAGGGVTSARLVRRGPHGSPPAGAPGWMDPDLQLQADHRMDPCAGDTQELHNVREGRRALPPWVEQIPVEAGLLPIHGPDRPATAVAGRPCACRALDPPSPAAARGSGTTRAQGCGTRLRSLMFPHAALGSGRLPHSRSPCAA